MSCRYLYWCDYGQQPKIVKSFLDGSNITDIVTAGIQRPMGIAVDIATHNVYWVDSAVDAIQVLGNSQKFDLAIQRVIRRSGDQHLSEVA